MITLEVINGPSAGGANRVLISVMGLEEYWPIISGSGQFGDPDFHITPRHMDGSPKSEILPDDRVRTWPQSFVDVLRAIAASDNTTIQPGLPLGRFMFATAPMRNTIALYLFPNGGDASFVADRLRERGYEIVTN